MENQIAAGWLIFAELVIVVVSFLLGWLKEKFKF